MRIAILLLAALTVSCASTGDTKRYNDLAAANAFDFYFDKPSEVRTFATIEEAQDYVGAAQARLSTAISKRSAQGLAARLKGPEVKDSQPVVVWHFFNAADTKGIVSITGTGEEMKQQIQRVISLSSVFLVFYDGRGVSIADFYLATGYQYRTNSQYKQFNFNNSVYQTEYSMGWGMQKAFDYLKKTID